MKSVFYNNSDQAPLRLRIAKVTCRYLPPLLAARLCSVVYPQMLAFKDKYKFRTTSQTGALFEGTTNDLHSYPFAVYGYYDWRNWAIALAVSSFGNTIIEIGANVGTETVGFRDIIGKTGHVHAFEPMLSNIEALRRNIEINNWTNVSIHPIALGSKKTKANFVMPSQEWASGIGHLLSKSESPNAQTINVEVLPLDSIIDDIGIVHAIFVDTEGAEMDVLDGAKKVISTNHPIIVLEASPRLLTRYGKSIVGLRQILTKLDYTPWEVTRFGLVNPRKAKKNKAANWVCLPKEKSKLVHRIRLYILLCGVLPCIAGLNPLSQRGVK